MAASGGLSNRHFNLARGGTYVKTSVGAVQFGAPPETIKDAMMEGVPVPTNIVVPKERFCLEMGPNEGLNLAEVEFPAYFNFFVLKGKVNLIVESPEIEQRIRTMLQQTLLGPTDFDMDADYADTFPKEDRADLVKEMSFFSKFGDKDLSVDMLVSFTLFDDNGTATLEKDGKKVEIHIDEGKGIYILKDLNAERKEDEVLEVPLVMKLPLPRRQSIHSRGYFEPPLFGVTVLGSSHGFDPMGSTSGYVLWLNRRGIMIDPPPNTSIILENNNISPALIDSIIVTHCHADHDAGTFQKLLTESRLDLITTKTIKDSFVKKYAALSGLKEDFLANTFSFREAKIGNEMKIRGGRIKFSYSLHSIPCIGFEVFFGNKSIVFTADHMNDADAIEKLHRDGFLSKGRRDRLLNFPWHHDIILHEAGVPPIHTPINTLIGLDDDIKKRLRVVHVGAKTIAGLPENHGLIKAAEGVENTIVLEVDPPAYSDALEILDLFCSIDLFAKIDISKARDLLSLVDRQRYKCSERIIEKGTHGTLFYIIESGVAEVVVPGNNGGSRTVKEFSTGDYFGEQSLLQGGPRTADIVAVSDVSLLTISKHDFLYLLKGTDVIERMLQIASMRSEDTHRIMGCNTRLKHLTEAQKTQLEERLQHFLVKKDEIIFEKGKPATEAVLVSSGLVKYEGDVKGRSTEFPVLGSGAFVGDIDAIVNGGINTYTLVALSDCTLFNINDDGLRTFFRHNPGTLLSMVNQHYII